MSNLCQVSEILDVADSIVILCHENPDGDAVGSALALAEALRSEGKQVDVIVESVPRLLGQLGIDSLVMRREQARDAYDAAVLVDCNEVSRCGASGEVAFRAKKLAAIDHHIMLSEHDYPAYVCEDYGAAAMAVMDLLKYRGYALTEKTAEFLYVALSTDTGHFAYSNTDEKTMFYATEIFKHLKNAHKLYEKLYAHCTAAHVGMMKALLNNMHYACGKKIAYSILRYADFERENATAEDAEGLVNILRNIETVEACFVIRENADGLCNVSMRASEKVDASKVMACFGGGGHSAAAGARFSGDPEAKALEIVEQIEKELV